MRLTAARQPWSLLVDRAVARAAPRDLPDAASSGLIRGEVLTTGQELRERQPTPAGLPLPVTVGRRPAGWRAGGAERAGNLRHERTKTVPPWGAGEDETPR